MIESEKDLRDILRNTAREGEAASNWRIEKKGIYRGLQHTFLRKYYNISTMLLLYRKDYFLGYAL